MKTTKTRISTLFLLLVTTFCFATILDTTSIKSNSKKIAKTEKCCNYKNICQSNQTSKTIILDNPETIQGQIKQLRNLIIEYHYSKDPWYKEYMSAIIALCTLLIAFFTQKYFFERTAKKELKKDIAKLYAEFTYYSKEYVIHFFENNHSILQSDNMARLKKNYTDLLNDKSNQNNLNAIKERITYYNNCLLDSMNLYEENKKRFKELKFNSIKPLYEIQFHIGNKNLEELIKEYEGVSIYTYGNDQVITNETLEQNNYLAGIMEKEVAPRMIQLNDSITKIQNEIKAIKF